MIGICPKCRGELVNKTDYIDKKVVRTIACKECGYDLSKVDGPLPSRKRRRR